MERTSTIPVAIVEAVGPGETRRQGLACIVSPGRAVTAASLVSRVGEEFPSVMLSVTAGGEQVEALGVASDLDSGLAAFPFAADHLPAPAPATLAEEPPHPGERWRAWVPTTQLPVEVSGGFEGPVEGRPWLRLSVHEGMPASSVPAGTPVFRDEQLVALVVGPAEDHPREVLGASVDSIRRVLRQLEEAEVSWTANATSKAANVDAPAAKAAPLPADLFDRLSASSHKALDHADGMRAAMGQSAVHMEQLILALYQKDGGPTRKELTRAGIDEARLRKRLGEIAEAELPAWGAYEVSALTALPVCSAHVSAALAAADAVARELGSKEVQSRHLFYGVLSVRNCGAVRWMLEEHGVDAARIDMTAEPSRAVVKRARAQVSADLAEGDDLLDVAGEAEAICAIVAARETSPPLSIGLFGDWGTGKTFFMGLMEKRIEKLKETARKNEDAAYCPNIVQLRFNAWHYIDTDLWASLTAEIFDGLAAALRQDSALAGGAKPQEERARLLAATTHLRDARTETERRKADADAALRASEERLSSLARDERDLAERLSPRAILKATYRYVAGDETTGAALIEGAEKLGIPKAKALASETRAQLLEVKGAWGDVKAIGIALRSGSSRLWLLLLLVTLAALIFGWQFWNDAGRSRWAVTLATLLGSALAFLGTAMPLVRGGLRTIREAREASDRAIREEHERREKALREAHAAVQKRVVSEEATIDRINSELAELERQLELLRADRQMADFIWEKEASTDYTRHFGVIARARHDFTRLSMLLDRVVSQREDGAKTEAEKEAPVPRIDRIVLYIDDLDRCPEEKVVDVLQAVHLLLAFPLFIVVVGVDSRWLLHSLRQHASVFRQSSDDSVVVDEEEQVHWESTPFNYLEKIFQIPFNLRPMNDVGFAKLIDNLTIPKERAAPSTNGKPREAAGDEKGLAPGSGSGSGTGTAPPPPPIPNVQGTGGDTRPAPAPVPAPAGEQAPSPPPRAPHRPPPVQTRQAPEEEVDPNPPFLSVSPEERAFMHEMHRLIPTPRAAKRYVNVYRLFRASLSDARRHRLEEEGGRSRQVLLMLAILTGFPQEGAVILRELVERQPTVSWWTFLSLLGSEYTRAASRPTEFLGGVPKEGLNGNGKGEASPLTDYERQRAQRWAELNRRLDSVRREVMKGEDPPCSDFTEWAKFVARYSFESGRVLTARQEINA